MSKQVTFVTYFKGNNKKLMAIKLRSGFGWHGTAPVESFQKYRRCRSL